MEIVAAVWMILILSIGAVAAVFALPRRLTTAAVTLAPQPAGPTDEETRYAAEVAVAADRAAVTAQRARAAWAEAQDQVDAAWTAYEQADREARRVAAAAVYPVQRRRRARRERRPRAVPAPLRPVRLPQPGDLDRPAERHPGPPRLERAAAPGDPGVGAAGGRS